ncbi:MAG: TonB family protein [Pedobacter sp.]|uniref:TonB family protein n=1 Tax=Pedobacter sp. TaxID=1411316 RepID=UPI0028095FC1|nr:TonB family protein [Pedobacter sp.]MDQ8006392.1 TonB family protein [Pedobacter sp.]
MSWSHYLLQVNIYLIVFYAFYRLLLAKETYFVLNRIYLISSGIFSLAIPFMQIDWFSKREISQQIYVQVEQLNQFVVQDTVKAIAPQFSWGALIVAVYLLGIVFFFIRFAIKLLAVRQMFKGIRSGLAFSFWNKKIVSQNLPEAATVNHHEDIHIKQLHTADVIFFELLGIFTWFNPIIYLYKETVKNIHEYLADEAAAKFQGDKELYSMLLLNQAFGVNVNTLTNGFFKKSMIKKRIFMLYKERSRKTAILKYGIFVPLFAAALLLSSATIKKNNQLLVASEKIQIAEVKAAVAEVLDLADPATEAAITTKVSLPAPKTEKDDDLSKFYKFLGNHIKYPSTAADNHVQGNLVVNFSVKSGKPENIVIEPKMGYGADEEVMIALSKYDGKVLNDGKYSMRIEYRLNGANTALINDNATVKKGHKNLNTITITGYAPKQKGADDEDNTVYSFVSMETPPSYPGGITEFYKFLSENIKYPEDAKKSEIQGNVFVSFTVEKDGSISDIKIDRRLGYGTDEEAVRVLQLSKKWNPGMQNGKAVRVKYNIPIKFALKKSANEQKTYRMVPSERISPESFFAKDSEYLEKTPLVILDGKIYEEKLSELDPKKIESISVLKDISSTSLYGEKGKNGVVLITTKKDKSLIIQPKN